MNPAVGSDIAVLAGLAVVAVVALSIRPVRVWLSRTDTAVAVLAITGVLAAVGVLVGQNLPPEAYAERHGPLFGSLLVRLGLTSVFSSWYFLLAVTVLALSILACTFGRIRGLVRARRRVHALGSLVTHVGLVIIIAGGIVTTMGGFRRPADRYVRAGGEIEVPEGDYALRVDEARTEFTEDGVISEYVSVVTVIEDGREVGTQRIEVNHPLVHRGIGVYQYEMLPAAESVEEVTLGVICRDEGEGESLHELVLPFREEVAVPGTATTLKAVAFLSHFTYDIEQGTAELVSVAHENPAVLVQVSEAGAVLGERWAFLGMRSHDTGADLPCRFFLLGYRPDYERALTRFEFTRQPGTPLLYVGFVALSLGLVLVFWIRAATVAVPGRDDGGGE
jgi:cytochrome c biogenesis protein